MKIFKTQIKHRKITKINYKRYFKILDLILKIEIKAKK